ncbi:MAG: SLC13 family permease [Pseudomonadota bacterium]
MTTPQIILFVLLAALFGLLVWGRWRYDVVAFATLLAAVVTGLVPAGEAFTGFGHPATITVAAVLILSRALASSGATDLLAKLVMPATGHTQTHIGALMGVGGTLSSFMNNVGTLGLLMPVALQSARKAGRPAALILMPLSFGCILGGLVTLIGTPPNIIVANIRAEVAGEPFGMFSYSPVGLVCALAGIAFVALIGWRLVPLRAGQRDDGEDLFDIEDYVTEVRVPKSCKAWDKTLDELEEMTKDIEAQVVGLIRGRKRTSRPEGRERLQARDVLVIEAAPTEIDKFITALGLELVGRGNAVSSLTKNADAELLEAVIAQGSRLEGRSVESLRMPSRYGVNLIALSRQGKPHRGRLRKIKLRIGDVLLLHGDKEHLADAVASFGCLPLAERDLNFGRRHQAPWMIGIFALAIAAASLGLVTIPIALGLAVAVMVVANMIPVREIYDGVDWPVIVLLGALIPVGGALQSTGATEVIADGIVTITVGAPPVVVLVLLMVVTMTLSDILNNAATAVVMAPIGISLAERLGVAADPFLMAVAVGASCAFLTPIGHQNNALVMGPGGYRFSDYWRMGLPLEVIIVAVATPMILVVWPF